MRVWVSGMHRLVFVPSLLSLFGPLTGCGNDAETAGAFEGQPQAIETGGFSTPELAMGEEVVKSNCVVCHKQGINGAPIIGNNKMWEPRVAQGEATLLEHATNGFGLMPAKAGNNELTEEDLRLAIRYMLSRLDK